MELAGASAQRHIRPLFCNCSAIGCGLNNDDLKNVCATFGGCRKTISMEHDQLVVHYACVPEDQYRPPERPLSCNVHRYNQHVNNIACCRNYSFCNQDLNVQFLERVHPDNSGSQPDIHQNGNITAWHITLFAIIFFGITILLVAAYLAFRKRFLNRSDVKQPISEIRPFLKCAFPSGSVTGASRDVNAMLLDIERVFDENATGADSGRGPALLVPRTVAHCVELNELIGKGRFGEVFRGRWKSEDVAIKIFASRDEQSWLREVDIYETHMMHHDNILRYIAADNKDSGISMKLYLITEYHPEGSLYDYLNKTTVNEIGLCVLVQSIASGLSFLHSEINGARNKPAIAHRDVKSKNILVKMDNTCCIADLGLAVRYDAISGTIDIPSNGKLGTRRYLAPEVLDGTMSLIQFDNYRRADIYSLGLVIWEICWRTTVNDSELFYQLPYFDMVQSDPSLEEMRKCVCEENRRPVVLSQWNDSRVLREMCRIMRECWTARPDARLTALRVKKSVGALITLADDDNANTKLSNLV